MSTALSCCPPPAGSAAAGCELRADQWESLWSDLVGLMRDGVRRGRIDTVRPEHDPVR